MKYQKRSFLLFIIDLFIITGAFLICLWYKPATKTIYLPRYLYPFFVFVGLWSITSYFSKKYSLVKEMTLALFNKNIIVANFISLGTITLIIYSFHYYNLSRLIIFGTVGISTILEIFSFNIIFYLVHSNEGKTIEPEVLKKQQLQLDFTGDASVLISPEKLDIPQRIKNFIINECNEDVFDFLIKYIDPGKKKTLLLSTTTVFNVQKQMDNYFKNAVNLKDINNIRYINKFFESVNSKLPNNGLFIGCAETKNQRKKRIINKYPPILNRIYYFFDFIFKRFFPKFSLTKRIYFILTRGEHRVLTRAEILGRLYSCGFEVIEEKYIGHRFFFTARKVKPPVFDKNPTYGPFIKLRRVGKNNKIIKVHKFRTMHPYAEYLQEYVYQKNQLQEGGKFKDDFRVSTLGKIMRKLWIDELPMILNLLGGDMKIVGVRPISQHYFSLYPKELQEKRTKYKPGLVPPFYADMPKTMEEIVQTELKYLEEYSKKPRRTDIKYFFKAFINIVFKKARSN